LGQIARLTETIPHCASQVGETAFAIERLAAELETASKTGPALRRLRTIPVIGPVIAGAVAAVAPISRSSIAGAI
jgi:transposase